MSVDEIPLSKFGLATVPEVAAYHKRGVRIVQRWIANRELKAVVVGSGQRVVFLVPIAAMKAFKPRSPGPRPKRPRK